MIGEGQYITLKDLKKYPKLYEEAIKYLDLGYDEIGAQNSRIANCMKSWYHHPFGRDFWADVSYGDFDRILRRTSSYKVAYNTIMELLQTNLIVTNNALCI